ncbi:unnamed protein product [Tetraodon nigroviridis]|uniref:(spotted green pufferfish) hypothetical protein n=1 Tax=Tetraodon nigroviridis TaxID=99883 RepID=Q4RVN3_TETNG|nr:unnamed protein product [Tetraodon nigroviridis]
MTPHATPGLNTNAQIEDFNFMENSVAALIRLMTQPEQTRRFRGSSMPQFAELSVSAIGTGKEEHVLFPLSSKK